MKNKGFVLLSVIFSVTLLLTVAVAFAWFARNQLQGAATEDFAFRARCAAREACEYAAKAVSDDKNGYDSIFERLYSPTGGIALELGGFKVRVKLRPLNDRISLQGLFLPDGITVRTEYEEAWNSVWNEVEHPELAEVVLDFMDKDEQQRLGSTEKKEFLNRPLFDLSELKLLDGINDELLYGKNEKKGKKNKKKCLSQFISVLGSDKINVNSANAETLAVLDASIGYGNAQSLVAARNTSPVEKLDDLKRYPGFSAAAVTKLTNVLSTESTHFELLITVSEGKRERNYKAVIKRGEGCSLLRWEE